VLALGLFISRRKAFARQLKGASRTIQEAFSDTTSETP